jgi:hypothetical protein
MLKILPDAEFDSIAIAKGWLFECSMIGGGGRGSVDYIYPSLMDPNSATPNYDEVGRTATLFLVTDECVVWDEATSTCLPWDSDGVVHRDIIEMPVQFS